ncbi:hypothetical protein [Holospora curviuscula]|uniref:hypothetical protein n=1 Tax=Holospora curviuscula TaxID=1082868 RepID=UPI0013FD1C1E|nr:hypothetical protein [Holospora curviuscula]
MRSKPASTIDMDCLEHDITMNPNAYQPERFGVSAVGILKALRCLDVRDKKP